MALPITPIVNVTYDLPAIGTPLPNYNLGLILGASPVISAEDRVVVFGSLTEMVDAGFADGDPEYDAAKAYFAANSQPTQLAIGKQDSGETVLAALQECRTANQDWYMAYCPTADDADHADIAEYVEALTEPFTQYIFQTAANEVLTDDPDNIFETFKEQAYAHTMGIYATDDHVAAAVMGYAMGQTSDLTDSAYTLKFKTLPGVSPDNLTTNQVNTIKSNYGNVYVTYSRDLNVFDDGRMFSGAWFDEILGVHRLTTDIQTAVANQLVQTPKLPQTEEGMAQLKAVISNTCQKHRRIGFIAPGKWTGGNVNTLKTGDILPTGYLVISDSISDQAQAARDARQAPAIYVPVKLAGAIHSVVIKINVNR